jgi:hypothetical protein
MMRNLEKIVKKVDNGGFGLSLAQSDYIKLPKLFYKI